MKDYVTFCDASTEIFVNGRSGLGNRVGSIDGYKLKDILHGGRRIDLTNNNYYYIPIINRIVSYKAGSQAKEMQANEHGKLRMREKFKDRKGAWTFHPDASAIYQTAYNKYRG